VVPGICAGSPSGERGRKLDFGGVLVKTTVVNACSFDAGPLMFADIQRIAREVAPAATSS
jgi:hypothetical protein